MRGPTKCLEADPTCQSILLGGRYINLQDLSEAGPFNHSYLSYILIGKRVPSTKFFKRIADELGMTMDDLLEAIEDRKREKRPKLLEIPLSPINHAI